MFYRIQDSKPVESFPALPILHPDIMQTIISSNNAPSDGDIWNGHAFVPEFTPQEISEQVRQNDNAKEYNTLDGIDADSIRSLREWVVAQPNPPANLVALEASASASRGRIRP